MKTCIFQLTIVKHNQVDDFLCFLLVLFVIYTVQDGNDFQNKDPFIIFQIMNQNKIFRYLRVTVLKLAICII